MKKTNGSNQVLSVVKTLTLLENLAHEDECSVTELAKRVDGNKSTVYRFLNTLKALGYVRQIEDNEKYSLTLKLFEVGSSVLDRLDERKEALPIMEKLAAETGETIHLALLDHGNPVYLHKIDSKKSLKVSMMSKVGHTMPIYCTGLGKVFLSWASPELFARLTKELKLVRFTANTITSMTGLRKATKEIRDKGFAVDDEEHEVGVRCVAAPIMDRSGEVTAALSVSGPAVRMSDSRLEHLGWLVVAAASEISRQLGFLPTGGRG